jgi:hypothetical protein
MNEYGHLYHYREKLKGALIALLQAKNESELQNGLLSTNA